MIVDVHGICKDCKRFCLFNEKDGSGICSKIYAVADYPEGMEFSKEDDEIILACPFFKDAAGTKTRIMKGGN